MSDELVVLAGDVEPRAEEVKSLFIKLKESLKENFFDMCDLLLETSDNKYHLQWGYSTFEEWITEGSDLDISPRSAFYYMNISRKAALLGVTKEQLRKIKVSSLKEIFSLEPDEHQADILRLLEGATESSLQDVKDEVSKLRAADGHEPQVYMTLKLDASIKEAVQEALELAKLNYGDTLIGGEFVEPSTSKCMELIVASYLQDPNNRPEGVHA